MVECVEDVVRQTGEQVYDEPGLEVVHPYNFRVRHDFASGTDERRMEIENDIYEEDNVYYRIDNEERNVLGRFVLEGYIVRDHYSRVERQAEYDPIPYRLEGAVVQKYVWRSFGRFLSVLWHHICIQRHHLKNDRIPVYSYDYFKI